MLYGSSMIVKSYSHAYPHTRYHVETPMNKGIQTIYDSMTVKLHKTFFLCEMNADS